MSSNQPYFAENYAQKKDRKNGGIIHTCSGKKHCSLGEIRLKDYLVNCKKNEAFLFVFAASLLGQPGSVQLSVGER